MRDADCTRFLQWALPRLELRWRGFRKVRRQVCRRIDRRMSELGIADVDAYRLRLEAQPEEWEQLDALCRIPISRFYRDRGVFDELAGTLLPRLAEQRREGGERQLRCWSAGCASGEEPYTLALIWELELRGRFPELDLRVVATDVDAHLLERARCGRYRASSLRELPAGWVERAFEREADGERAELRLSQRLRERVEFRLQDIRRCLPRERFHLVLCRNLVFTYFEPTLQRRLLNRLRERLEPGGLLVLGRHEALPEGAEGFSRVGACSYRKS